MKNNQYTNEYLNRRLLLHGLICTETNTEKAKTNFNEYNLNLFQRLLHFSVFLYISVKSSSGNGSRCIACDNLLLSNFNHMVLYKINISALEDKEKIRKAYTTNTLNCLFSATSIFKVKIFCQSRT